MCEERVGNSFDAIRGWNIGVQRFNVKSEKDGIIGNKGIAKQSNDVERVSNVTGDGLSYGLKKKFNNLSCIPGDTIQIGNNGPTGWHVWRKPNLLVDLREQIKASSPRVRRRQKGGAFLGRDEVPRAKEVEKAGDALGEEAGSAGLKWFIKPGIGKLTKGLSAVLRSRHDAPTAALICRLNSDSLEVAQAVQFIAFGCRKVLEGITDVFSLEKGASGSQDPLGGLSDMHRNKFLRGPTARGNGPKAAGGASLETRESVAPLKPPDKIFHT